MPEVQVIVPPIPNLKVVPRFWNRLEPRARSDDFSKAIQARIYDPLWMIARQWQLGEFKADDAGSPVSAQLSIVTAPLTRYSPGPPSASAQVALIKRGSEPPLPIEMNVEQEPISLEADLLSRIQIGQQFEHELKIQMAKEGLSDETCKSLIEFFREEYGLEGPSDEDYQETDDKTCRFWLTLAGKAIDAKKMREKDLLSENPSIPGEMPGTSDDRAVVALALRNLWQLYCVLCPWNLLKKNDSWRDSSFDYAASVSAPSPDDITKQVVLYAPDYKGGSLDWYSFDQAALTTQLGPDAALEGEDINSAIVERSFDMVPKNLSFRGMPNARWWQFEDGKTDFGKLDVPITDIGKLLVMEFALVYGNDWFIVPVPLEIGSLCKVASLTVLDVFGLTTPIQKIGSGEGEQWQAAWNMYTLTVDREKKADFLFLPPSLGRSEESPPIEDVRFLRDEMENLCFAVEHTFLNGLGEPMSGYEYYRDRTRRKQQQANRRLATEIKTLAKELGEVAQEAQKAAFDALNAATPELLAALLDEAKKKLRQTFPSAPEDAKQKIIQLAGEETEGKEQDAAVYRLESTVPGNWIPYIPVHTGNSRRSIQFRRAAMIGEEDGNGWSVYEPRTAILKGAGANHMVHEETITRAGTRIRLSFQRARWIDGSTHVWIGRRVGPGRGEGSSGLRFDFLDENQ